MSQPFDLARFQQLLGTERLGRHALFEASVGSTMDLAREAARSGASEGTLAIADEQTAGRGRLGRAWVTPPALNLASTLVLRPPPATLRAMAMIAPLAVCEAAEEVAGVRTDIKWPNDVQIRGNKCAGVLIETDLTDDRNSYVLVGCGINVNFDPRHYPEIRELATSLRAETGHEVDREAMLASYLLHFETLYNAACRGSSPLSQWRARLITLGKNVQASWPGGSAAGIAEDVDENGALIIRTHDGIHVTVEAGDVTLRA